MLVARPVIESAAVAAAEVGATLVGAMLGTGVGPGECLDIRSAFIMHDQSPGVTDLGCLPLGTVPVVESAGLEQAGKNKVDEPLGSKVLEVEGRQDFGFATVLSVV